MKKAWFSLGICLILLAIAGLFVVGARRWKKVQAEQAGQNSANSTQQPQVEVMPIERTTVEDRLVLTGTAAPWEDVTISAETTGKIERQEIEEGDLVEAGQELVRVDTKSIQAMLDQAEAQARLAQQEYERAQSLTRRGVSAERDYDSAVAGRDVAEANLRAMRIQLEKSVVKAPFDGVVDSLFRDEREFVDIGSPLLRIVQVHKVKALVGVPERDVSWFKVGDPVRVRFDAIPDEEFQGTIHSIATTADIATHTFATEIELDNPEGRLKPGMIARATLVRRTFPESILVPIFSTFLLEDQRYAVAVKDGSAQLRTVKTGILQGGSVQILDGLEQGDLLIVKGQYDVRDGELVQVTATVPGMVKP